MDFIRRAKENGQETKGAGGMRKVEARTITLTPPEGVPLTFEIAAISDRFQALFIDILWIILLFIGVGLLMFLLLYVVLSTVMAGAATSTFYPFAALFILAIFAIRQGYFLFFELLWQGSTPGKRKGSIRVVSRDGKALTAPALIARNLFRDIELFFPIGLLLSPRSITTMPNWVWIPMVIWVIVMIAFPFMNHDRLRLGDFVGGTMVIRIPRPELLSDKARQTDLRQSEIMFLPQHLSTYGEYELETLAGILRKTDEGKADNDDLRVIAKTIAQKIGYEGRDPFSQPLTFLRLFYTAQRNALEKKLLFGKRKASKYVK